MMTQTEALAANSRVSGKKAALSGISGSKAARDTGDGMGYAFRTADKIKFEAGDLVETPVETGHGAGHPAAHGLLQTAGGQGQVLAEAA